MNPSIANVAARDDAEQSSGRMPRFRLSLRAKAIAATAALLVYSTLVAVYVAHEREKMVRMVQQLEAIHNDAESIIQVNASVAHAIVALHDLLNSPGDVALRWSDVLLDISAFRQPLAALRENHPEIAPVIARYESKAAEADAARTHAAMVDLRDSEIELVAEIERLEGAAQRHTRRVLARYAELDHYLTVLITTMIVCGLLIFGVAVTYFFSRVAADLGRLEERALAVAGGYRGVPLEITRSDEVGRMMDAVNRMQQELALREHQQEVSRQQRFHQEKMAAIGSLAAAVAHEVGNPINSISGIAQHVIEDLQAGRQDDRETQGTNARLILGQTERIAAIVRNLADLSATPSPKPQVMDLNELLRNTCSFLRYDKRFRNIDLAIDVDAELPAVRAVADHVTQIVMNLVINAADAMEGVTGRRPRIVVSTRRSAGEIVLAVSDNGIGMEHGVLVHAFDQSFTTKPAGKGRGIGLYLCKTLMHEMGGRMALESVAGTGTVARLHLPIDGSLQEG